MNDFLLKAEELDQWLEKALAVIKAYPRIYEDLDLRGLQLGHLLLRRRVIPEVKNGLALPVVVLLCGGTNTGKSTLTNSLAGRVVSATGGGVASFTKRTIAVGPLEQMQACVKSRPGWQLRPTSDLQSDLPSPDCLFGDGVSDWPTDLPLVLDTPDIDSSDVSCRANTAAALSLVDMIIWLTTQQKYKDKAGMTFLDDAMALVARRVDIFNQYLPRHGEALTDLEQFYRSRWPQVETRVITIPEQPDLGEDGFISQEALKELKGELRQAKGHGEEIKMRNIAHGLQEAGALAGVAAQHFLTRQQDCSGLKREIKHHFEDALFSPLNRLAGHAMPFELQAALIRVISPKIQTSFSGWVTRVNSSARQAASWAFSFLNQSGTNAQVPKSLDPTKERDRVDVQDAVRIIEVARFKLLADSRNRTQKGNPLFRRFHDDLKKMEFLRNEELRQKMMETLEQGYRERLLPLISRFELDLDRFCNENPTVIGALKAAVPGFSAIAGVAAAAFSIHTMTILPGVTEYLLGGIAFPIYSHLEKALPTSLVGFADRISQEPFIQKARENFSRLRASIFLETADWLVKPVESLLETSDLRTYDVVTALKELQYEWSLICKQRR